MSIRPGATLPFDPQAKRFYAVDFEPFLAGAEVASYSISISPDDGTLVYDNDAVVNGEQGGVNTAVEARYLGAGSPSPLELGVVYTVTVQIVTNEAVPQTDDRSFYFQITSR